MRLPLIQLFINNEWHRSKAGGSFDTINPTTEQKIAEIQCAGKEDVDLAVKAARNAFRLIVYFFWCSSNLCFDKSFSTIYVDWAQHGVVWMHRNVVS